MTDDDLKRLLEVMRQENATAREENATARQENAAAHVETRRQFEETVNRISAENQETVDRNSRENREYFEVATEAFKHQIALVAENVVGVTEELHREAANIRLEMRTGFADTQAMIRFSHAELDRRVRALEDKDRTIEETLADVQARLDRLEASTH